MSNEFLKFADEIISTATKTRSVTYDELTRNKYNYDFDEENQKEMNAMRAIAQVYEFSFEPIVHNGIVFGFKIEG